MRETSLKKVVSVILSLTLLLAVIPLCSIYACEENSGEREEGSAGGYIRFRDVGRDYWAYDAIEWMARSGILTGYGDGKFKPDNAVTRAEFAKMMVNAMKIKLVSALTPSFVDVKKGSWYFKYVESSKYYLTGYRTASGDYFKPDMAAVREDMAVALVKALGYSDEEEDASVLRQYTDVSAISAKLKRYVSLAIKYKIMQGFPTDEADMLEFRPQETLTRAQASVILYRAMKQAEEKVTYEDEKITYDNGDGEDGYPIPAVNVSLIDGKVFVKWRMIDDARLEGYKVVISRNNPNPRYPDDGYLYWITNRSTTSAVIDNNQPFKGGDFGEYLTPGVKYYFSVTAVYSGGVKVPGNAIMFEY